MSISSLFSTDNTRCNQQELSTQRYNRILNGINSIISIDLKENTEEELRNAYLSVVLEITGSKIGFIGEVDKDGLLKNITVSDLGWDQRNKYDKSDHKRLHRDFILNSLYGCVIDRKKGFFTNDPLTLSCRIGSPPGNSLLTSFLGVPLIEKGKAVGMLAVANRERGYSCEQLEDLEAIVPAVVQTLRRIKEERERRHIESMLHDSIEQMQTQAEELHIQSDELQMQNEGLQTKYKELQVKNGELQAQSEELKESNKAFKMNEKRFHKMANEIPQLAWIAHADGYIYWYNDRWYAYTGTTLEQMEGWGWQSVHDPAVLPKVLEQWRASIATGQTFDMEFPLRGSDGIFRPFLTRVMPLKDAKGHVLQWFGTNTDITERKQEEHRNKRHNRILEGINRIFSNVVEAKTEEELGNTCLSAALDLTGGGIGFVNLLGNDGLMHDIAISEGGWEQCMMYDKTGHRRQPGNFIMHGLYGHAVKGGKGFFTYPLQIEWKALHFQFNALFSVIS